MTNQPGFFGRMWAIAQGEVSAEMLEAYRRAGNSVHDLLHQVESQRLDRKIQGLNPWTVPPALQAQLLCTWNAFALQTLGNEFLEADYQASPATVGYVPPKTAEQILAFYTQVEGWLSRARQAQSNPNYALDVRIPADLPSWSEVEPCPQSHLEGMRAAARSMRNHTEAAMAVFESDNLPADKQAIVARLRQMQAEASTKADYAEQLWGDRISEPLHEQIETYAKDAIERYYKLGQLLAMPQLVELLAMQTPRRSDQRTTPLVQMNCNLSLPGRARFDPWCLTDPTSRDRWQRDSEAIEAIEEMWKHDPDPSRTLAIQAEINAALNRGDIAYATDRSGKPVGHFYCCPWSSIYVVKYPVSIAGRRLRTLQEFTFVVDADEVLEGGEFERQILVGSFQPTTEIGYCNPHEGRHH